MKKYLTVSIVLILCIAAWFFISSQYSFNISLGREKEVQAGSFQVQGKEIYRVADQKKELFEIRGVNLESILPGHFITDFAVSKEQYQEWFQLIQEMGANTIRIPTILNSGFYDALYSFNSEQEEQGGEPLYLIQVLWVTDYAQDSRNDAYSNEFFGQLRNDVRNAVDVLHGNKLLSYAKTRGNGWYTKDVSDWVLGITLGTSWKGDTSAYTNHMRSMPLYAGQWFRASEDATQFENMLTRLLDILLDYETTKYGQQHMVSIASEPLTDPFDYEDLIDVQINKYDRIDAEHIIAEDAVLSGFFVSFKLYDVCSDILDYLTEEEQKRLAEILPGINREGAYDGYLELLENYYSVPIVVGDCGFSTSRGITKVTNGSYGLTEEEQGEALVKLYRECQTAGFSGMVISNWQDDWSQTDWNIYPLTEKEREPFWHNVQSEAQGYGLLAFEPGEEPVVTVDGDPSEWEGEEPVISNEWGSIFCRQDEAYLYLCLKRTGVSEEKLYIPIDITQKSGSRICEKPELTFERDADFLLRLNSTSYAQLLVQAYYDPWRAAWNQNIEHIDAYTVSIPDPDTEEFIPMRMILKSNPVYSEDWNKRNAKTFDTGRLRFGIADPEADEYDSLADFYTSGNCTEIRIPWELLNFQDPSYRTVHDDYYEHYGVEGQKIKQIYLGLGSSKEEQEISMEPFTIKAWGRNVKYRQRLKRSYYIVQSCWKAS